MEYDTDRHMRLDAAVAKHCSGMGRATQDQRLSRAHAFAQLLLWGYTKLAAFRLILQFAQRQQGGACGRGPATAADVQALMDELGGGWDEDEQLGAAFRRYRYLTDVAGPHGGGGGGGGAGAGAGWRGRDGA